MAAGLRLRVDTVKAIEDGVASDQEHDWYKTWLGLIEDWATDGAGATVPHAGKGGRFNGKQAE